MSNDLMTLGGGVPAHISKLFGAGKNEDLSNGVGMGFSVFSIRGSKWRVVTGGVESLVKLPGTDDAAPAIEVTLLKANPALSKTYYAGAFVEGSDAPPDCFSNDGVAPDPSCQKPQAKQCAACPQNVWGSKITPQGSKVKACADVRRLAVAPSGDLKQAILLRVPGASLSDLAQYGKRLNEMGVHYSAVVTKLAFDADAAYPKITFKAVRYLTEDEAAQVLETMKSGVVDEIVALSVTTGMGETAKADTPATQPEVTIERKTSARPKKPETEAPAPAPAAVEEPQPTAAPEMFSPEQVSNLNSILAALDD